MPTAATTISMTTSPYDITCGSPIITEMDVTTTNTVTVPTIEEVTTTSGAAATTSSASATTEKHWQQQQYKQHQPQQKHQQHRQKNQHQQHQRQQKHQQHQRQQQHQQRRTGHRETEILRRNRKRSEAGFNRKESFLMKTVFEVKTFPRLVRLCLLRRLSRSVVWELGWVKKELNNASLESFLGPVKEFFYDGVMVEWLEWLLVEQEGMGSILSLF